MVHNFAFFQNFSVPSSSTNEWTRRALTDATPRVQKACVVCARMDYVEHRYEVYLFGEPTGMTSLQRISVGNSEVSLSGDDPEAELFAQEEERLAAPEVVGCWADDNNLCLAQKEQAHAGPVKTNCPL